MKTRNAKTVSDPGLWDLTVNEKGGLTIGGCLCTELAAIYGTPVHIVNRDNLKRTALSFSEAVGVNYPGKGSLHFAFKCNPVPGIINCIKESGLKAEVMSEFELFLASRLGFEGGEIIVNGPFKHERFLKQCLKHRVKLIIIDSLAELEMLDAICTRQKQEADILLRINPDYVPAGMNQGSATGSRKSSHLGLDMNGGEVEYALKIISSGRFIRFRGLHFHIGSGIRRASDYRNALLRLVPIVNKVLQYGFDFSIMDVGGGFGVNGSREMNSFEILEYQVSGKLPLWEPAREDLSFGEFVSEISAGIETLSGLFGISLPELIIEPGRSITSPNQVLLLRVHNVKKRDRLNKWIITDGGIGTVTMPTFYEFHQVLLCDDMNRRRTERVTITGPGCFAADIVYRGIQMPEITTGEVLAILDSGAYFTSWESSFSYPLPPIVMAYGGTHELVRRRETPEEMIGRDLIPVCHIKEEF